MLVDIIPNKYAQGRELVNQEGDYRNEDEYEKQMGKSVRIRCGFRIGSATGVRTADDGEGGCGTCGI